MNLYGFNNTLFDLDYSDAALIESISSSHLMAERRYTDREEENLLKLSNSILKNIKRTDSPPKRRHDGTSPLPLGMDWSPPPRNWDGPNTIWPHVFPTGWSYCVTVPSWNLYAESRGSEPVVFYRVQIGLQSPEGVTITHEVLRRFSDFLKLFSDLKRSFRNKKLPPGPPKGLLRTKNRTLLEERRCSLEAWMEKALSDIDISRSAPVACFLELEAAARSSFRESSQNSPKCTTSDTPSPSEIINSCDVHQDGGTSSKCVESDEISEALDTHATSDLQILTDTRVVFPLDEQKKVNSLHSTVDVEDLMARSYQENEALHQELESAKEQLKNLQICQEEADLKSKSDIKLLVKEVISVRRSQSELQQELDKVLKEKMDFETRLEKERTERESVDAANRKLVRECEILRGRLEECSVSFLDEQEKKLKMEFPADALDILATSENRIGLLLEEAQLLARDIAAPDACSSHDRLRKMVTDVLIENAILRKRENSLLRCALNTYETSSISQQQL